eukprot:NODE_969_length_1786_cov_26.772021_g855_i0.p1 GENE.NODE_969_length_1786_cov_26.772021_g855_i0~~NODE_969_length_1786_cov_26.772021_g855_i0.p1  ORF type:complete len:491 (-),score=112.80 NODE_969_length_1786_cov_26.772021_g855_i0:100-1572(-)
MYCIECGLENVDFAKFCLGCGAQLFPFDASGTTFVRGQSSTVGQPAGPTGGLGSGSGGSAAKKQVDLMDIVLDFVGEQLRNEFDTPDAAFKSIGQSGKIFKVEMLRCVERYMGTEFLQPDEMDKLFRFLDERGLGYIDFQTFANRLWVDQKLRPQSSGGGGGDPTSSQSYGARDGQFSENGRALEGYADQDEWMEEEDSLVQSRVPDDQLLQQINPSYQQPLQQQQQQQQRGYGAGALASSYPNYQQQHQQLGVVSLPVVKSPRDGFFGNGDIVDVLRSDEQWARGRIVQVTSAYYVVRFWDERSTQELEKRIPLSLAKRKLRHSTSQSGQSQPPLQLPSTPAQKRGPPAMLGRNSGSPPQGKRMACASMASPPSRAPTPLINTFFDQREGEYFPTAGPASMASADPEARMFLRDFKFKLEQRYSTLRMAFLALDTDRDGSIGAQEFCQILQQWGIRANSNQLQTIVRLFDLKHDGLVTHTEFINCLNRA